MRRIVESGRVPRRSPYDREILRLAAPALGALAAEPLYLLCDTAIVGPPGHAPARRARHRRHAAGSSFWLFNFLTYGTTAQVARLHGAGREEARRARSPPRRCGWRVGMGVAVAVLTVALAGPPVSLMGGEGRTGATGRDLPAHLGASASLFALIALAGQGYLRGVERLRTPAGHRGRANAVNVVLEVLFVYGFGWGLPRLGVGHRASPRRAWAPPSCASCWRRRRTTGAPTAALMRPLLSMGGHIAVRTGALLAAFVVASAVLRASERHRWAPTRSPSSSSSSWPSCSTRSRSPARS